MSQMNETIINALNFRHATKIFDSSKQVSDKDMQTILESGRLSPSSLGLEPWRFVVIESQELKDKLKPYSWGAQNNLIQLVVFVVILARKMLRHSRTMFNISSETLRNMIHIPSQQLNKSSMISKQIFI